MFNYLIVFKSIINKINMSKTPIKTTKRELKAGKLDLIVSGTVFTPITKRVLVKETDFQNKDNVYVNIRALKRDMRTLGYQEDMLIRIKPKGDSYEATVYLPKQEKKDYK